MLDFVIDLAHRAGAVLRARQEQERSVESKGFADVVTDADRASEALIVEAVRARYPDHGILAEEGGQIAGVSEYQWVIDPLDGTLNYLHGLPLYSVSLAVLRGGEPYIGVVYEPTRGELFAAERGAGARCNGRRLRVSPTPRLAGAILTTGFPYERTSVADNNLREHERLLMRCQDVRRTGSAALELAYVAAGRVDAHWELGLKPWDVAAGALIALEAGGTVTDWEGRPWRPDGGRLVASNGRIHAELLGELAAARA